MTRFRIIYQQSNIEAPQGRFDIGRSLECNLILDDPSVSRIHATIVRQNDDLLLEDRGSRNGCTLNGKSITGVIPLSDGDIIGIGHQTIRISAIQPTKRPGACTMGIIGCPNCATLVSMEADFCTACGASIASNSSRPSDTSQINIPSIRETSSTGKVPNLSGENMLAGLAQKALSKNRTDEAWKLTRRLMETISNAPPIFESPESDMALEQVANLLVDLALHTREAARIADLFFFFRQIKRLLPRKTVDRLYAVARGTGYRTSTELHQYIACLSEMTERFSPGEKFIFRRIEGLVGLCN